MPSREEYEAEARALGLDPGEYVSAMMGTPEPAPRVAPAVETKKTAAETKKKAVPEFSPPPQERKQPAKETAKVSEPTPMGPPSFAPVYGPVPPPARDVPVAPYGSAGEFGPVPPPRPTPSGSPTIQNARPYRSIPEGSPVGRAVRSAEDVLNRVEVTPPNVVLAGGGNYSVEFPSVSVRPPPPKPVGMGDVRRDDAPLYRAPPPVVSAPVLSAPAPAPAPLAEPTYGEKVDAIAQAYGATTEQVQRLIRDGKIDIDAGYLNAVQKLTGK